MDLKTITIKTLLSGQDKNLNSLLIDSDAAELWMGTESWNVKWDNEKLNSALCKMVGRNVVLLKKGHT